MSSKLGAVKLGQASGEVFLGRDMGHQRDYSEDLAEVIDSEVRELIENAHDEAWKALTTNRKVLDKLAEELLEKETLNHNELDELFKPVKKLAKRKVWLSSTKRPVSTIPPIKVKSDADKGSAPKKPATKKPASKDPSDKAPTARKPRATKPATEAS